jgi:hypothetical protein
MGAPPLTSNHQPLRDRQIGVTRARVLHSIAATDLIGVARKLPLRTLVFSGGH